MNKKIPDDRLYSDEHEWIRFEEALARIGISDHAQCSLGDVVYVELPKVGTRIEKGKAIGVVESVKAVSDIYAPVSGTVTSINQAVIDRPEIINTDPYNDGWLLVIEDIDRVGADSLLSPFDYQALLEREAKA